MIGVGISPCMPAAAASIPRTSNPATHPSLMAGAFWIPDTTIEINGDLRVQSGGTQQSLGTRIGTETVTGDIPLLTTSDNGAVVWDFTAGSNASLAIPKTGLLGSGPGVDTCLQWTTRGAYAMWAQITELDETSHYMLSGSWGVAAQSRMQMRHNLGSAGLAHSHVVESCWTGTIVDSPIGTRAKYNGPYNTIDWTAWNFFLWDYDYSLDNFASAGANYSNKLKVYCNGVLLANIGYSAPNPVNGGDPPDGPIRGPLFASTGWLSVGADGISSPWKGRIGPVYASNGAMSLANWDKVIRWKAPRAVP